MMERAMVWTAIGWTLLALSVLAQTKRVCIVGAGIGGSSTAKFLRDVDAEVKLDVFEKREAAGGRMKALSFDGLSHPVEAGASILHKENRYVLQFAEALHLEVDVPADRRWGIYDGRQFLFLSSGSETIDAGKLWWRYGRDLMKMRKIVEEFLQKFSQIYTIQAAGTSFSHPIDVLKTLGLYDFTQTTLEKEMLNQGISKKLIDELMTAVNRVNYGQDCQLNTLAGMVGLAGVGSNLRIVQDCQGLLKNAGATVHLNTTVQEIVKVENGFQMRIDSKAAENCDAVVIAAPLEQSNITLPSSSASISRRDYHLTETTFVRGALKPAYFGITSPLPDAIYTVESKDLPFNSIGCLTTTDSEKKICKVFSRAPLTPEFLNAVFDDAEVLKILPWRAYPHFSPPEQFSPFVLEEGLVYINTIESAASAMEVSAIGGKNAALLVQKWLDLKTTKKQKVEDPMQVEL